MSNYARETQLAAFHALDLQEITLLTSTRAEIRTFLHLSIRKAWVSNFAYTDEVSSRYSATHLRKVKGDYATYCYACKFGHLGIMKYLHSIDERPAAHDYGSHLYTACICNQIETVKYLHETYTMTVAHLRTYAEGYFYTICTHCNLTVVKYLHTDMGMTLEDVRANNCTAFFEACARPNNLEMVKYFCTDVGITPGDIRASTTELRLCVREVVEYFKTEFGIF